MTPPSARARALYGLHLLEHDEVARANALLLEAAADSEDWLVQYHVATGLGRTFDAADRADPRLARGGANCASRACSAPGPNCRTRWRSGRASMRPTRPASARRWPTSAAPASWRRGATTTGCSRLTSSPGAASMSRPAAILDVLAGPGFTDAIRANARSLLAQVDRSERIAAERIARLEGRQAAAAAGQRPGPPPRNAAPRYREVNDDETRLEGVLERITCTADGIQLHVKAGAATERFDATTLDGIEFISYREDLDGAIGCGVRTPPDPIYVTWKKAGATRQLVAVEFLLKP